MADDSLRRALQNALSLIYGIRTPSSIYREYSFAAKIYDAGRRMPFSMVSTGKHNIFGRKTQISGEYLEKCKEAIEELVKKL